MKEEKKLVLNLQKVSIETEIDKFEQKDLSKVCGNMVFQVAGDIGLEEKARELYHKGKVELTESMMKMCRGIVEHSGRPLYVIRAITTEIDNTLKP